MIFRSFSSQDSNFDLIIDLQGFVFAWMVPLLIVYLIEGRDLRSIGLVIERKNYVKYFIYSVVGLIIPAFIVGFNKALLISLVQQLVSIGVAEEVLWRGFLQARLSAWLGKYQGWVIASLLFGFGHLVSLWSHPGINPEIGDLILLGQTTAGGFILGFIFLRAKSIVPGAIFHVFGNVYLFKLIDLMIG